MRGFFVSVSLLSAMSINTPAADVKENTNAGVVSRRSGMLITM